jgi:acid phosphatase
MKAKRALWACLLAALPFGLAAKSSLPKPDHVVLVIEENHSFDQILGKDVKDCPYIKSLSEEGALMTKSFAVSHPSEPNYLALFAGTTYGIQDDECNRSFKGANLASGLLEANLTFGGYSEDLPSIGFTGCKAAGDSGYRKKHNPWVFYEDLTPTVNLPFKGSFPAGPDYSSLPTVSIVVPNQMNDMHDGEPAQGDQWLKANLDGYIQWAKTHNSLFILTWDEDNGLMNNQVVTLFLGPMVHNGKHSVRVTHYSLLRTLCDMFGVKPMNKAKKAKAITAAFEMVKS